MRKMLDAYVERRAWLLDALNAIPGISCSPPDGAFYVFPSVRAFYGRKGINDSTAFAKFLLEEARVASLMQRARLQRPHLLPGKARTKQEYILTA